MRRLPQMLIEVNGCKIYVEDTGHRNAHPMLVLHSPAGGSDLRSVKPVFERFASSYRMVFFDLRGSGRSELRGIPSFSQLAQDIESLREQLELGQVILAGGSGGGFLAIEYAIRYPQNLLALLLRGTGPKHMDLAKIWQHIQSTGVKVNQDRFERYWTGHCRDDADMKAAIEEIAPLYAGNNGSNPLSSNCNTALNSAHFETHNYAMQEQMNGWDVTRNLNKIMVPTLVVHGDKDWVVPLEFAKILAQEIPNSRLEVFERCGHSPQLEEPDRFVSLVFDFLAENNVS